MYFNHLWHWAEELARVSSRRSSWIDLSSLHLALLNITPEGHLQRETKDIIEELMIMTHIVKKQKEVLKNFKRHGESLLDPRAATETDALLHYQKHKAFQTNADALLEDTDERLEVLEELKQNAEHVCRDVSGPAIRFGRFSDPVFSRLTSCFL